MTETWKAWRRVRVVAIILLAGGSCGAWATAVAPSAIDSPIVFTQLPSDASLERQPGRGAGTLRCDYGEGGRIVRLDPDGQLRVLTEAFSSACGADVSFDGKRILFAAKREPQDPWNVWEMNADGSGVRQITRDLGNCRSPAYQATLYTIVSAEPWYQIMFVSDAAGALGDCGIGPATSLYSCRLDGSAPRRLTVNLSDDVDPFLMSDGRVLLAVWQRMDLRRGFGGRVALFGVNTDGADYALYCGDQGQRIKHMPCETTDGLVVFVEADRVGWDGAGQLACVTLRRNLHSYRPITNDEQWLYHSPSPLPGGAVLVSRRPACETVSRQGTPRGLKPAARLGDGESKTETHGIYRLDPRTGRAEAVFDDPRFHDVHARSLTPRPQPDGRSSVVNEKYPTGALYCLNAYITDHSTSAHVRPGLIRGLRVIEGVPPSASDPTVYLPHGRNIGTTGSDSTINCIVPVVQRRLLGQVPVQDDGSFHVELPADVPVQLQTLDENGMALRSCGWIWVKHREPRGCIGCHEDPELTPENRFVLAVQRPAMKLTLPPERRRTVDFRRDVMPIILDKCTCCHNHDGRPPDLRDQADRHFNLAYQNLLAVGCKTVRDDEPVVGRYIFPGKARASRLIWRLYGRNTSRPWDRCYNPEQTFAVHPPPEAEQLTDDEKRTIVEWIDLGAPWGDITEAEKTTPARNTGTGSERVD